MSASVVFVCGLAITLLISTSAVVYVRSPLRRILIEICGNVDRAVFWTAFSSVIVSVVPVIFAMQFRPETGGGLAVFELADQLKWGLVGLVVALGGMALVIAKFIPHAPAGSSDSRRGALAA